MADDRLKRLERLKKIRALKFLAAGQDATTVGSDEQPEEGALFPHVPGEHFTNRLRTLGNAPQNFVELVSNVGAAAVSPVETTKGLVQAAQQLPFEVFKRGFEKFTGETLPEFPGRIPEGQQDFGKAILDDFTERYGSLEAIDKTSTERPAEFAADLSIFGKPAAAAARMPAVSNIASKINPLDLGRRGLGALGRKTGRGVSKVAETGETALIKSSEVLTGTQENPAKAFKVGQEGDAAQSAAFHKARLGETGIEDVRNVAIEVTKEVFDEEVVKFNTAMDKVLSNKRVMKTQGDPFVLASKLDKVKAAVVENLERFRVEVKGRRELSPKTASETALDRATGARQPFQKKVPGPKAKVHGGEHFEGFGSEGTLLPKSGIAGDATKKIQNRPGSARSMDMSDVIDPIFDNSTIGAEGQRSLIKKMSQELLGQETTTLKDLNSLLQRIDSHIDEAALADPGLRSNAFVVQMRKQVRDILSDVDGYDDAAKIYEEATKDRFEFAKTFSLDAPTMEGALNKFEDALGSKASKKHREKLLDKLGLQNPKAKALAAEIAGVNLSEFFGKGLIGRSVGTALLTGGPTAAAGLAVGGMGAEALAVIFGGLATFAVSSPRVMGRFMHTLGATDTYVKNVTKIAGDLLKAADTKGIATQGLTWGQLAERVSGDVEDTPVPTGHGISEGSLPDFSGLQR